MDSASSESPEHTVTGNILIVDDKRENLRLLADMLLERGHTVRAATSGKRALIAAEISPPDLILLDVLMPDMNGYEVCKALKANPTTHNTPVIFVSALHEVFDKVKAFAVGGVDYITKPVQTEEVLARVETHLTIQHTRESLRQSESLYRAVVEDQTELICRFRSDGMITFVNEVCCRFLNRTAEELISQNVFEYIHGPSRRRSRERTPERRRERISRLLKGYSPARPVRTFEHYLTRESGETHRMQWTIRAIFNSQGRIEEFQSVGQDITERVKAEERLRAANEQLARWVSEMEQHTREHVLLNRMSNFLQRAQSLNEAVATSLPLLRELFARQDGALYLLKPAAERPARDAPATLAHLTFQRAAAWGIDPPTVLALTAERCQALARGQICLAEDEQDSIECLVCPEIGRYPCLCIPLKTRGDLLGVLRLHCLPDSDDAVGISDHRVQLAAMAADLVALALSNLSLREQLREQAIRDPLTGLFNRRFLAEALTRELQQADRYQRSLVMLLFDLDHFKKINDTYGHEAGDEVLRQVGTLLNSSLRGGDIACRYGGEEILLVMPEIPLEAACFRAEELRAAVRQMQIVHNERLLPPITASIGLASFPHHGTTAETLIAAADNALYQAKSTGRDRVCTAAARADEQAPAAHQTTG